MADVYSAIILDTDYWDGTESWAGETSEANRDSKYSTRRFTSVQAFEADRDGKSSSGDDEHGVIIGPWSSNDTTKVSFAGWDADTVIIECPLTLSDGINAARHNGIPDNVTNAYKLYVAADNYPLHLEDNSPLFIVDGLHIVSGDEHVLRVNAAAGFTIKNCIIEYDGSDNYDFGIQNTTDGTHYIYNNVIFGCVAANGRGIHLKTGTGTVYIYNNSIAGCTYGIYRQLNTPVAKNNAVFNSSDDFYGTITIDYCASDDGDGTNEVDWDSEATDWAKNFNDYANGDFTIGSDGANADIVGAGIGPDSDGAVPTTDIIGNTRSGATCTIGAFEYQAAGWTGKIKGVTDPSKILGVAVADITAVTGVE